jgi:tetrahydromethanopterin S-methyltransferase subunit B
MAEVETGKVEDGSDDVVVLEVDQASDSMLEDVDTVSSMMLEAIAEDSDTTLGVAIEKLEDNSKSVDTLIISSV